MPGIGPDRLPPIPMEPPALPGGINTSASYTPGGLEVNASGGHPYQALQQFAAFGGSGLPGGLGLLGEMLAYQFNRKKAEDKEADRLRIKAEYEKNQPKIGIGRVAAPVTTPPLGEYRPGISGPNPGVRGQTANITFAPRYTGAGYGNPTTGMVTSLTGASAGHVPAGTQVAGIPNNSSFEAGGQSVPENPNVGLTAAAQRAAVEQFDKRTNTTSEDQRIPVTASTYMQATPEQRLKMRVVGG